MIRSLIRFYMGPDDSPLTPALRNRAGHLSGAVGLSTNVLLSIIKGLVGMMSGSVAIIGDALNNLTDAVTALLTFVSFRLSARPADESHPYGHARTEYIISSIIGAAVMYVGVTFMRESFHKIVHPSTVTLETTALVLLLLSILAKLWMWRFYALLSDRAQSTIIRANATDSISDVLNTSVIVASLLLSPVVGIELDGYLGLMVGLIILKNGLDIVRSTADKLLGERPDDDTAQRLMAFVRQYDGVLGVHDLIVHDYGPYHTFATLHVEVDARIPAMDSHALVNLIEVEAKEALHIELTIHTDPIDVNDPRTEQLRLLAASIVRSIDERYNIHDFRLVEGHQQTLLVFDLAVPPDANVHGSDLEREINRRLTPGRPHLLAKVTLDPIYMIN